MFLVVIPLVLVMVRTRPPGAVKMTVAEGAQRLEGFELDAAVRTRSFWVIVLAFLFAFAGGGSLIHMVAYLIDTATSRATPPSPSASSSLRPSLARF
jgi:hypothetical protein